MSLTCVVCGCHFEWSGRGRRPAVCGQRCRKRRSRSCLPLVLREQRRWCAREAKRPVQVSGVGASSTDESTWCSYEEVSGVPHGIMLGRGLACWDLDDVIDSSGVLHADAVRVLNHVGSDAVWVERSMSGRGLHVFVWGGGRSRVTEHVSYYAHSRFIAVTGERYVYRGAALRAG